MNDRYSQVTPKTYQAILEATSASGFTMSSEVLTCSLLRTLAGAKPAGRFLELGTGTGLSTAWILDGMDQSSSLISIDNDENFQRVAGDHLGKDHRLSLICIDGAEWIEKNKDQKFDYVFADTWHGKYIMLEEMLSMINPGGLYIIDDMLPQPNWPEGHDKKAENLLTYLDSRNDFHLTRMSWASGIVVATKKLA